jgi:hypothetical protein
METEKKKWVGTHLGVGCAQPEETNKGSIVLNPERCWTEVRRLKLPL